MVTFVDLFRRLALRVGGHRHWCAMCISAGDHDDMSPGKALKAREDIRGQIRTGDIAYMDQRIGIRPGDGDKNMFTHFKPPVRGYNDQGGRQKKRAVLMGQPFDICYKSN